MASVRAAFFVLLFVPIASFGFAAEGQRRECSICGMYLDQYASTVHVIVLNDGTIQETCSLSCAAKIHTRDKVRIKTIMAADFPSTKLIDTGKAVYLEGSDVPGVMSRTSRIAFRTRAEAADFQKKHGGTIISFQDALQHQSEE